MLEIDGRLDGAVSADGRVMGCYLHGLFASDGFRRAFLRDLGAREPSRQAYETRVEATLDGLADHLERALDLDRILAIALARPQLGDKSASQTRTRSATTIA
jgi:adenosylcobyric acid synthase